jgi:hypothetical protein
VGNFYVNFSIKDSEPQQVADVLDRAGRRAIVTPSQGGYVVAYDEEADRQATRPILIVGGLLSHGAGRPVLAVLNHDDDVLCYWLFEGGELADSYNSNPDAFDEDEGAPPWQVGDAEKLCASLGPGAGAAAVEAILRGDYVFAVDRHQRLAEALGLPPWSVGLGYGYAAEGELEDEMEIGRLIRVGGRPA